MYEGQTISYLVPCNGGKEQVLIRGFESLFNEENCSLIDEMLISYNDVPEYFEALRQSWERFFSVEFKPPFTRFCYRGINVTLALIDPLHTHGYKNSAIEKNRLYANATGKILVFADPEIYYPKGIFPQLLNATVEFAGEHLGYAMVQPEYVVLGTPEEPLQEHHEVPWWYVSIFTRHLYETLGGLDNIYSLHGGWGCEDDDLWHRLHVFGEYHCYASGCRVYHLPHPVVHKLEGHAKFNLNTFHERLALKAQKKLDFRSSQLQEAQAQGEDWTHDLKF